MDFFEWWEKNQTLIESMIEDDKTPIYRTVYDVAYSAYSDSRVYTDREHMQNSDYEPEREQLGSEYVQGFKDAVELMKGMK